MQRIKTNLPPPPPPPPRHTIKNTCYFLCSRCGGDRVGRWRVGLRGGERERAIQVEVSPIFVYCVKKYSPAKLLTWLNLQTSYVNRCCFLVARAFPVKSITWIRQTCLPTNIPRTTRISPLGSCNQIPGIVCYMRDVTFRASSAVSDRSRGHINFFQQSYT